MLLSHSVAFCRGNKVSVYSMPYLCAVWKLALPSCVQTLWSRHHLWRDGHVHKPSAGPAVGVGPPKAAWKRRYFWRAGIVTNFFFSQPHKWKLNGSSFSQPLFSFSKPPIIKYTTHTIIYVALPWIIVLKNQNRGNLAFLFFVCLFNVFRWKAAFPTRWQDVQNSSTTTLKLILWTSILDAP